MDYILQVCPDYYGTKLYHNLFVALENHGERNIVYVSSKGPSVETTYKVDNIDKKFNKIDRLFFYKKQRQVYDDIVGKKYLSDIKIIHAHTLFSSGNVAYNLYKKYSIPYIVAIRNSDVNVFFKYMIHLRNLGLNIMRSAQKIIFISESYKEFVLSKYIPNKAKDFIAQKSEVIPNGIDKYFLDNKYYYKHAIDKKVIKILYVGEITKNKNIETTLKTCLYLQKLGYTVTYTIVGEMKNNSFKRIINHSLVSYYSKCCKEQVLKHMRDADIFIMPSITETFGLVYPEAMSQGLPIIYTKNQGFDGYFPDGEVGYAVDKYDYKMIVQRVIDIISDYEFVSKRCIENVDIFDWEKISLRYINLYNQVIS